MRKVAILLTSLLIAFVTGCQDHNLEPDPEDVMAWRAGGPGDDTGRSIAVDKSGNAYVTGVFTGSVTFGSTTLTSNGISDIFIVKYNNKGEVLWAHRAGGPNPVSGADLGSDIVVDEIGNVYITGYFSGTATFGPLSLTSNGSSDMFIGKYNSNGEVQWVRNAGGSNNDQGSDIALDKSGNLYATGSFEGTATFGSISLTSRGLGDVFITRYNSNGDVVWAKQAGGAASDSGEGIAVDESGHAYITGYFRGNVAFGSFSLTGRGREEIFIAKYSSTGEAMWAQSGDTFGYGTGIAVDKSGNVYVTGTITDSQRFDSWIYFAKYNTNGEKQWIRTRVKPSIYYRGEDITVDKEGNVYLTSFNEDPRFSFIPYPLSTPGETVVLDVTYFGGEDVFVAKFDSNGILIWVRSAGGTGNDTGYGITVDESGTVYATGSFEHTATFGSTTLTSSGGSDIFVVKFK